jgi:uncharacterized protein (TIGR01777 family)
MGNRSAHQKEVIMHVIITGGTGLLGRALAEDLANAGYEVILLSRQPEKATALPPGVRAERWDGRTANGWGRLAGGAEAIVNLAGENLAGEGFFPRRWTPERKEMIVQSRLNAGAAVVEAVEAAAVKPRVVIQSSGIGAYGPRRDEELSEEAPIGSDFLAALAVKWEASTAGVEALGVRRAVIRTGAVLSTAGGALTRMLLPFRLFAGGWFGNGRQWFSWIHLADEVAAIRFLIENPKASGVFNLTAPQSLTSREFGRSIGRVMGRPAFLPIPGIAVRLAFGEVATVVLDGQRVLPRRLLDLGFRFRFPDADSALRDLLKS